jgi:hypothetical protein
VQVDADGQRYILMDCIFGHKKDAQAVSKNDEFDEVKGKRVSRMKPKEWKLCI